MPLWGAGESVLGEIPLLPSRETAEVIIGYRWWRIWWQPKDQTRPILVSEAFPSMWIPGEPMVGVIERGQPSGVHAWDCREASDRYGSQYAQPFYMAYSAANPHVCGEVNLWGKVIKHERGYRAEKGYPRKLFVPKIYREKMDLAAALRREYGVEAEWY